jgi:hypothetical protein
LNSTVTFDPAASGVKSNASTTVGSISGGVMIPSSSSSGASAAE